MRLKLFTVAFALAAMPFASHAEDLLEAYRLARANDPTLSQADSQRLASGEGVVQARSALLPQANATLSLNQADPAGPSRTQLTDAAGNPLRDAQGRPVLSDDAGHTRTRTLNANITQTVVDFSKLADLKAAHSSADSQNAAYDASAQQLFARVASAYFLVLTNDDALTFAKANEQALARQLEQAQQRFDVGLSAITDVQDAKAQHDSAVASVITAENTLADSREALTQITGKPSENLKKLREQLPMDAPTPNDPNAWVAQAVKTNPTIISGQYNVDANEHSISAARAGHLPTLGATASYGKSSSWTENLGAVNSANNPNGRGTTTVGLTLTVPIFSGGYTQSKVRQAIYNRDSAQDSLEITRRQVVRDTLNYYRSVVAGISKVGATKAAVESAESARDATQAGFEVGTRTIVDVLIAQQNLTQALSNYSQARHQFILDKLLLKQTAGTVDFKDMETINSLLQ
ncbi:MAG: Outer membrane protein TolC [Luteibacter sp.]|uniref:TolC family outer membrane protein n=1 Tax=Luteibacter sp. TaxID=1886636 RepID=UPI00137FA98F|nr:TolC family outer membrane protein [Luteibacter sp.]KAF1004168.1 MAG: Outer membrane protein TolC [Luteibacter sp.]